MNSIEYLRTFRLGQFAVFDIVISYVGILVLSPLLTWLASKLQVHIPVSSWLWFTLPLAVVFHVVFQQKTPLMKILADPSQLGFYGAVIILSVMTYMGLRSVHKIV